MATKTEVTKMKTTAPEVEPKRTVPPDTRTGVCARCGALGSDFISDGRSYCGVGCTELERRGL